MSDPKREQPDPSSADPLRPAGASEKVITVFDQRQHDHPSTGEGLPAPYKPARELGPDGGPVADPKRSSLSRVVPWVLIAAVLWLATVLGAIALYHNSASPVTGSVPGAPRDKGTGQDTKERDELAKQLAAAEAEQERLAGDLDKRTKELASLQMAKEKAPANDEAIAAAKKVLAERDTELSLLRPFKDKWQADEGQIEALKKDVGDASITIEDLRASRDKWRALADQRFTGLDLTGRRVVFLVDMSGSMEYIDDNTPAPQKWLEVRNTVAKLMHNLPDLEKFQVIVFSEKTKFLLGNDDKWLDFDAKTSPDKVTAALAAVKPDGGTNMYAGLDAAFRFRPQGLDAVYLLSDGLPNLGEGLKPEENAKLTELERAALLGTYIRKKLKTDWNTRKDGKAPVRLNSLGFFYESPDVGAFLWALSRENEGGFVGMSKP